jgi:NTE family protein
MKRALVLSGGGARGSYQIGVWKALRELDIKYDIITGTSVGALNGALMVQDSYDLAEKFWYNVDFDDIFKDKFFKSEGLYKRPIKIIYKYVDAALKEKGLDVSILEKNLQSYLDEEKFYKSDIDYGLVTYDLADRKPLMLTKKEIPREKLKDFIMASATAFPVFKKRKIANKYYIDGGFYDNFPINLAIKMGATEIIAVYLGIFGFGKNVKNKNIKITYIEPKSKLGFPFFFERELARRGMRLGYNDTFKVFGSYEGDFYTFEKDNIMQCYNEYKNKIEELLKDISQNNPSFHISHKLLKKGITMTNFLTTIESLGILFNIDESYVYKINEFNNLIIDDFIKNSNLSKEDDTNKTIYQKFMVKKIYSQLSFINSEKNKEKLSPLYIFGPITFISAIYLYLIMEEKNIDYNNY